MGDDEEPGLTDEDIEKLQEILEKNQEVGANEHTMDTEDDDRNDED